MRPGAVDRSNPLAGPALPGGYLMPELSDFDGDGRGEVAAMLHGEAGTYASAAFFEWPGTAPVRTTSGRFIPWSHHDLDGDGRLELMAVDARRVRLFEQPGPGLFPERRAWAVRGAWGGEVLDADGDGRPEMFLRSATAELFRVFESRGDDDYAETAALVNDTPGENELGARQVAADLDGDGRGDLLAGDSDGDLLVFEAGAGDSYRRAWRSIEEEEFVDGRLVGGGADLDGDGDVEFIGGRLRRDPFDLEGRRWRLTVYGVKGDDEYGPEWQGQVLAGSSRGAGIAAADLDGDGQLEWIAALPPHLYVFRADGPGGYEAVWHAPAGETWRPAAGDADGDGRSELFFNGPDGAIRGFSWTGDPARLGAPPGWAALPLGPGPRRAGVGAGPGGRPVRGEPRRLGGGPGGGRGVPALRPRRLRARAGPLLRLAGRGHRPGRPPRRQLAAAGRGTPGGAGDPRSPARRPPAGVGPLRPAHGPGGG